jgi:autotransporter-associated beta strand protein
MARTYHVAQALAIASAFAAGVARGQMWVGPGTDWNTATNWSPQTVPNSATAAVSFTGFTPNSVNISASVQAQSLSFANTSGSYTLTSSAGATLSGLNSITVASGVTGTQTINLATANGGSLLLAANSNLQITNNSTSLFTTLVIGPNTVLGASGTQNVFFAGPGVSQFSGSFAGGSNQVNGFDMSGPGRLIYGGSGTNFHGFLEVEGGTLELNYATSTASKGNGNLNLTNGVLTLVANTSTPVTQTMAFTFMAIGSGGGEHVDIVATSAGGGTITLNLGAVNRTDIISHGTLDVSVGSGAPTFSVTTSTGNTNFLFGSGAAYATFGGGATWATRSGSNLTGLTAAGYNADFYGINANVDVTTSAAPAAFTANSLRFNTGSPALTLSGTNTLQSGGILVTPSSTGGAITGGTLNASGAGELLVHQYSNSDFTVNSALVSTFGLTKTGPGTLVLGGTNTGLTGLITVSRGHLTVTTPAAVNSASVILFGDNRASSGLLQAFTVDLGNNVSGTILPPIGVSAFSPGAGAQVFSTGASTNSRVTLAGGIGGLVSTPTPIRFVCASSSGFNLTNATSSFAGDVFLQQGSLGITADGCLGNPANNLILDAGSPIAGGLEFLAGGITVNHPIIVNSTSRVVSNGFDTNAIAGPVTSTFLRQFVKAGAGTLVFSGNGSGLAGGLTLGAGTLQLDYSTNTASKLGSGGLTLNGGVLIPFAHPTTPVTQANPGGTAVAAGHTDLIGQSPGGGTITFGLGAITRSAGATLDVSTGSGFPTFAAATSTGNTNGLLGTGPAFATFGGFTWAASDGNAIVGLATYGANTFTPGTNVDVTVDSAQTGFIANSLRFPAFTPILSLAGTNTLQSGGILVTSSGRINGNGTLTAPGSGELIVHQYINNLGFPFVINASLSSAAGLTKTGPGVLTLGGANPGLTGPINVNRGNLTVTTTAAVNSASQINFNDNRAGFALQQFTVDLGTGINGTVSPPIRLSAFDPSGSATLFSTGNSTNSRVTLSGVLSSAPGLTTPVEFTHPFANTSGFNLTNVNTFTGDVLLLQGFLGINSDTSLGNPANTLVLEVGDTANGGLEFLSSGITVARPVVELSTTRIISNGTDSNTISGVISGGASLVKAGTGTLTITNPNNTVNGGVSVQAGTMSLGATGGLPSGTSVTVAAGATFAAATANSLNIATLTLNGGTFRVPGGSGQQYAVNQILTNTAGGTVDFTGAGQDVLLLAGPSPTITINGNSTWLSPGNLSHIDNGTGSADIPINIAVGVTLSNGFDLGTTSAFGFRLTGRGTLFQNADATNVVNMTAPITVTQGRYRVIDASSNGGVGNLGSGPFTLDGGTIAYGGSTAATAKPMAVTGNGGAIEVESAATTLTANGVITGSGGLTKTGPGTFVLTNAGNLFSALTINGGFVQTAADNMLGAGTVTINGGTLRYTANATTSRTFFLNSGAIESAGGATLTFNTANVNGGFLRGTGTFAVTGGTVIAGSSTATSATVNVTGPASFSDFSNSGSLNVPAGLAATPTTLDFMINQGSGSITVGASGQVNSSDFQTYGTLTLTPGSMATPTQLINTGGSPLYFNGGSRTFISVPANSSQFDAGIDLHGQNAVVAGGLFVNNGFVVDSAGSHVVVADFGSLVKGAGFYQNTVQTVNGGKFQSGNSPGVSSFGGFTFGPGGVTNYNWQIDDPGPSPTYPNAPGLAGAPSIGAGQTNYGWSLVKAIKLGPTPGNFTWTATSASPLTVILQTLTGQTMVGNDVIGPMQNFDPNLGPQPGTGVGYKWQFVTWTGTYTGPTDPNVLNSETVFDLTSGPFANSLPPPPKYQFGWQLNFNSGTSGPGELDLTYTAVPEPGTLALLTSAAGAGLVRRRFRRLAV